MPSLQNYSAGVEHGWIRTAEGDVYDVGAITNVTPTMAMDTVQVKGDDEIKTTFNFGHRVELEFTAEALSFDVFQAITGNSYSSSPTGIEIPFGTDSEKSLPYVEFGSQSVGKNADDGSSVTLKMTWYKVQLSYEVKQVNGGAVEVTFKGTAYKTASDIEGNALSEEMIGLQEVLG